MASTERAKLFTLIEDLVKWENSNNPRVINAARLEIARSAAQARSYNGLVVSRPEILKLARGLKDRAVQPQQQDFGFWVERQS